VLDTLFIFFKFFIAGR